METNPPPPGSMDDVIDDWYDAAIKAGKGFKSEKERQDYIKSLGDPLKHPMFATATEDLVNNPLVEAIRALKEEDKTLVQLAIMYKDEGNELMKKSEGPPPAEVKKMTDTQRRRQREEQVKKYYEAFNNYTHALTFVDQADKARATGTEDPQDASVDLLRLRSQILGNRAMSSLILCNYGTCCKDSLAAILCWPQNVKAHYRKCKSLVMLRKYELALLACKEAEETCGVEAQTKEFNDLSSKCTVELKKIEDAKLARARAIAVERDKWSVAWKACSQLHVILGYTHPTNVLQSTDPFAYNATVNTLSTKMPHLDTDTDTDNANVATTTSTSTTATTTTATTSATVFDKKAISLSNICWPVLFLYPQHNKLDTIQGASADDMLVEHLAQMFPEEEDEDEVGQGQGQRGGGGGGASCGPVVPWDTENEYHVSKLVVYLRLRTTPSISNEDEWVRHCEEVAFLNGIITDMTNTTTNNNTGAATTTKVSSSSTSDSIINTKNVRNDGGDGNGDDDDDNTAPRRKEKIQALITKRQEIFDKQQDQRFNHQGGGGIFGCSFGMYIGTNPSCPRTCFIRGNVVPDRLSEGQSCS